MQRIQVGPKAGEVRVQLYISLHCAVEERSKRCYPKVHKDSHSDSFLQAYLKGSSVKVLE